MNYIKNQPMTQMGSYAPLASIYKSESHKLHQAFQVKDGDTIIAGQPVQLNTDGTISPLTNGLYIGIAVTDSEYPAYTGPGALQEVTVAVIGFMITYGVASAAIANAGYVTPSAPADDSPYCKYAASNSATRFVALNTAEAVGDLVQILCI